MAEKPNLLNIDLTEVKWHHSEPRLDVTTGAPQKLYRHLLDAIQTRGYHVIQGKEPGITGTAIEKTGTTHGEILAEKMVKTISSPLYQVGIIFTTIIILYGLYVGVFTYFLTGILGGKSLVTLNSKNIIIGIVIIIIGVITGSITETFFKTKFESHLLYTTLKGEVYYSALGENVSEGQLSADSRRASMISDLRLGINLTTIFSSNQSSNDPNGQIQASRRVLQYIYTDEAEEDFKGILTDINTNILPKLMLKKQEEAIAKPSAGVSLKELNDKLDQINEIFDKLDESLAHGEINEAKYKELTEKYRVEADSLKNQIAKKKFM